MSGELRISRILRIRRRVIEAEARLPG
jgi:hypothetical protein